jgi:hypothetical protein
LGFKMLKRFDPDDALGRLNAGEARTYRHDHKP